MLSDDSNDSEKGESDKLGSESRSVGAFATVSSGLSCGLWFLLGVMIYAN